MDALRERLTLINPVTGKRIARLGTAHRRLIRNGNVAVPKGFLLDNRTNRLVRDTLGLRRRAERERRLVIDGRITVRTDRENAVDVLSRNTRFIQAVRRAKAKQGQRVNVTVKFKAFQRWETGHEYVLDREIVVEVKNGLPRALQERVANAVEGHFEQLNKEATYEEYFLEEDTIEIAGIVEIPEAKDVREMQVSAMVYPMYSGRGMVKCDDSNEMHCVERLLHNQLGNVDGYKKAVRNVREALGIKHSTDLIPVGRLIDFLHQWGVGCHGFDLTGRRMVSFPADPKRAKKASVFFYIANNHVYMIDKAFKDSAKQGHGFHPTQRRDKGSLTTTTHENLTVDEILNLPLTSHHTILIDGDKHKTLNEMWVELVDKVGICCIDGDQSKIVVNRDSGYDIVIQLVADMSSIKTVADTFNIQMSHSLTKTAKDVFTLLERSPLKGSTFFEQTMNIWATLKASIYNRVYSDVNEDDVSFDIRKAYSTSCVNQKHNFCQFSAFCDFVPFEALESNAWYIVKTNTANLFPVTPLFHTTELVCQEMAEELIQQSGVSFQYTLKPSGFMKRTLLNEFVKQCYEKLPTGVAKNVVNRFVGSLGSYKPRARRNSLIVNSFDDIGYYHNKYKDQKFRVKQFQGMYHLSWNADAGAMGEVLLPIHRQIMQTANLQVWRMMKRVGGGLLAVRTDAIYVRNPVVPVNDFTMGNWYIRVQKVSPMVAKPFVQPDRSIDIVYKKWKRLPVDDTPNVPKSFLLNDHAGTGKTYKMIQHVKRALSHGKTVLVMCFTNKLRKTLKQELIGLTTPKTLHSGLKMYYNSNGRLQARLEEKFDYFFIDEFSMIPSEILNELVYYKHKGVAMRFYGDYRQVPPVESGISSSGSYHNTGIMKFLCDHNMLTKGEYKRGDKTLWNIFHHYWDTGELPEKSEVMDTELNITYLNDIRNAVNEMKRKQLFDPSKEHRGGWNVGFPVICNKKLKEDEQENGDTFRIVRFDEKTVRLQAVALYENISHDEFVDVKYKEFTAYYQLAFCLTIHKVQGGTFRVPFTIWNRNEFQSKQLLYTAITRATSWEQISFNTIKRQGRCDKNLIARIRSNVDLQHLGCSLDYLVAQWKLPDYFTDQNYATVWNIDHILPRSHFHAHEKPLYEHYTNLRPLTVPENSMKKDS